MVIIPVRTNEETDIHPQNIMRLPTLSCGENIIRSHNKVHVSSISDYEKYVPCCHPGWMNMRKIRSVYRKVAAKYIFL